MKKHLFNVFSTVCLGAMILCACHSKKSVIDESSLYGVSVTKAYMSKPDTLNTVQIDSLVRVDKLPVITKWATSTFKDDELGTGFNYKTLYDKTTKTIYTIKILNDGRYVLSKKTVDVR